MKKILFIIAAFVGAASVHASYLYWQINSSDIANAVSQGAPSDITGVRIYALNDSTGEQTFLKLGYADYGTDSFKYVDGGDGANSYAVSAPMGGALLADVSDFSSGGYSFYVELINNNNVPYWAGNSGSAYQTADFAGQLVSSGNSDPITYTGLESKGFIGNDLSPVSMAVWHGGGSYSPVPEPTSAMLVLIGLAGLALKRRAV